MISFTQSVVLQWHLSQLTAILCGNDRLTPLHNVLKWTTSNSGLQLLGAAVHGHMHSFLLAVELQLLFVSCWSDIHYTQYHI